MTVQVPLTRGLVALIDDEDAERVLAYKWHAAPVSPGCIYATRWGGRSSAKSTVYLHRALMDPPDGMMVDHVNGNTLDCRRSNMRLVTNQQNSWNRKARRSNPIGVLGVTRRKSGKFEARILVSWQNLALGTFRTVEEASAAYKAAALKYRGEYAP